MNQTRDLDTIDAVILGFFLFVLAVVAGIVTAVCLSFILYPWIAGFIGGAMFLTLFGIWLVKIFRRLK